MSDGAEFSIDLGVQGGDAAASAASQLADLSSKLELAGAASIKASEAMKAGETAYQQSEAAAVKAATALEKIGAAVDSQKAKLAGMAGLADGVDSPAYQRAAAKLQELTARQSEAASKASSTAAAMASEAAALDKLKSAASTAADAESKLKKQQTDLKSAADKSAKSSKEQADAQTKSVGAAGMLEGAFSKLGGPLGAIGQKASGVAGAVLKMGKSLGAAGPYVAAAVLAVVLATAFAAATLAITHFAVSAADTARTQALLSDGIAGSVKGGRELDATLADLSNKVPIARDELVGMASDLSKSGLKGKELSDALEAAAIKAAKLKFGPDFAKEMLSLPNQAARLKSNITGLFSGLKIEGLLEGLSKLVALFDENSASGKAIKVVFESIFQPIVDGLTALLPKVVSTFLQIEIWILKALIAIKPWGSAIAAIGIGFGVVAGVIVAAIVVVLAIIAALVVATAAVAYAFYYLATAAPAAGAAIRDGIGAGLDWLKSKFDEVVAFLQGLSFTEIATNLIDGLVNGIVTAGPKVLAAITGLAKGAIDAAKKALGIASPSTIFAEIGMHTAKGMEEGVDGGAPDVQGSLEAMVAPPETPAGGSGGGTSGDQSKGGAGGGHTVTINVASQADAFTLRDFLAEIGVHAGLGTANA